MTTQNPGPNKVLFVLMLPSLTAGEPLSLAQAFALGRPLQIQLFLLIGGAVALSLLADTGLAWAIRHLSGKPWNAAAVAAAHRLVDCLLLAFGGHGLATIFRQLTGWHQPEPDDHPVRGVRLRARKA